MKRVFCIFFCSLGLVSCAEMNGQRTSERPPLQEVGEVLFVDDLFSVSFLESQGMSVLPMSTRSSSEGIRSNVIYEVQKALEIYLPKLSLITKSEILDWAKKVSLEKKIQEEVNHYERGGQLNHSFLNQIRTLAKTRYFLFLRVKDLKSFYQREMISKRVALEAEIWDSHCMKVVWLGAGRVEVVEPVVLEKIRFEEIFVKAARSLVAQITRGQNRNVTTIKGCAS